MTCMALPCAYFICRKGVIYMCFFKVKSPSVSVPGSSLVPQTDAKEPDSPRYGGTEDVFSKKRGRDQLTIKRNGTYNPTNY